MIKAKLGAEFREVGGQFLVRRASLKMATKNVPADGIYARGMSLSRKNAGIF